MFKLSLSKLSLRMLARDWRAGELRVLAVALVLAVASVTSVSFFADRVWQALTREAHQMLGGDLLLVADHPWSQSFKDDIARSGLARAESVNFVSMARAGDQAQLSAIKAVSPGYPLRGKLRVADNLNQPDRSTDQLPPPGTAWADERLMAALNLRSGDQLELGNVKLTVGAVLTLEPDRGVSFLNVAPRLLIHIDDLPATGLVQTGSRITYQLFAAGEREQVDAFERRARAHLGRGERIESLENARPEMRAGLDRAQQFLGLAAMLAVILAATAVALAVRRYIRRHLDGYAVMRCMGARQPTLLALFCWEFLLLGVAASAAGCVLGFAGQALLGLWLAQLVAAALPLPGPWPALQGMAMGLALLLGFALPPLVQLKNVPALRVLRRDVGPPRQNALAVYAAALGVLFALLWWQAGDLKLGTTLFGGFAAAFAVFALAGYFALGAIGRLGRGGTLSWRYGLANLRRRAQSNTVQIVALSLGLTAILLLTFIRTDLLESWRMRLPPDAPNRFLLNIQPGQLQQVTDFFAQNRIRTPNIYPMVRARMSAINGRAVGVEDFTDERARRQIEREFNMTYLSRLPPDNQVTQGKWFSPQEFESGAISVEHWIAERLGIRRGDRLTFVAAGQTFEAPVTSIRTLDWDTMRPNFFFVTTPRLMEKLPASFMTSFHAPPADTQMTARLSRVFPNVTVIDVTTIMRQVQDIMDQVIRAVQFVFLFALAGGVLVLYAALAATQDERRQEAALMRALGASRSQVLSSQRAEFAALGLVAGLLAASGASAIGYVLAARVFQIPWQFNGWIWFAGPALGLACVAFNAWAGARAALNHAPLLALREG